MNEERAGSVGRSEPMPPHLSYGELFWRFLRFGLLAFGGPVAQIAMIRRELVEQERWLSSERFNRLLAVMQVLPGPEAHELCVHLGIRARGRLGGLLAGLGFMLPGLVLMLALAWAYSRLSLQTGVLGAIFLGVQAAVIAVVLRAVHRIGAHILLDPWLWGIAVAGAAATLIGASFWIVLLAGGAVYAARSRPALAVASAAVGTGLALLTRDLGWTVTLTAIEAGPPTAAALFWAGLKGGLLTFGGAYTAIPFVRNDTVGRGWMTDAQFLDGLGLSGILPAPLVIFATFAGWMSGGLGGALAITAGMFLPAFGFSLLLYERLEAVIERESLQRFLAGVAAAVLGLIAVTLLTLAQAAAERTPSLPVSLAIFAASLIILYLWKSKLSPVFALGVGAAAGALALA
jgi:chromate transporter